MSQARRSDPLTLRPLVPDHQALQAVEMVSVGIFRRMRQAQVRAALKQDRQGKAQFQPGQRCPDAEMQTRAKTRIGADGSVRLELIWFWPERAVSVGRGQKKGNLFAALKSVSEDRDRFIRIAGEHVQRGIKTQDFLDGAVDPVWGQAGRTKPVFKQRFHAIAKRVHGGFVTGIEQQDAGGDQFIGAQPAFGIFGGDETGDQIILWIAAPLVDVFSQKCAELCGCGGCPVFCLTCASGLIHRHHGVGPAEILFGQRVRDAKKTCNDMDRQLRAIGGQQVEFILWEGVDQLVTQGYDLWSERFDLPRCESPQDQFARPCVARWFRIEHGMGFDGEKGGQMCWSGRCKLFRDFPPESFVAQKAVNRVICERGLHTVFLPMVKRSLVARAGVERIRVLNELGIGR